MQNQYTAPNGKSLVASVNGNMLTMYVPGEPHMEKMKITPAHKSKLGHAIKRPCFDAFAAVVDEMEG